MPKGFKGIREAVNAIEERKAAAQEGGEKKEFTPSLWWKLPNSGDSAVFRALEEGDDVSFAFVHEVKVENRQWPIDIVCRDQDNEGEACPGCEASLKRKLKGWVNIIWRDAPDFPQDENGRYNTKIDWESVGKSDKLAILSSGPVLFGRFDELDEEYDGLGSRDFKITRSGTGLSTSYKVTPVKTDGKNVPTELSDADKELAASKPDLSIFTKVLDYDEWLDRASGRPVGSSDNEEVPSAPKNPLGGSKKNLFA